MYFNYTRYADVIKQLKVANKEKQAGVLLHDNAPVHKSKMHKLFVIESFEQLNHPPYSQDPAPSDYYLFQNLNSHLHGTRFPDVEKLKSAIEA